MKTDRRVINCLGLLMLAMMACNAPRTDLRWDDRGFHRPSYADTEPSRQDVCMAWALECESAKRHEPKACITCMGICLASIHAFKVAIWLLGAMEGRKYRSCARNAEEWRLWDASN